MTGVYETFQRRVVDLVDLFLTDVLELPSVKERIERFGQWKMTKSNTYPALIVLAYPALLALAIAIVG
jgi:hypothetical protein